MEYQQISVKMYQRLADVGFLDVSLKRYEKNNYSDSYVDRTALLEHETSRAFVYLVTAEKILQRALSRISADATYGSHSYAV